MRRLIMNPHLDLRCLQKPIIVACGNERVKRYNIKADIGIHSPPAHPLVNRPEIQFDSLSRFNQYRFLGDLSRRQIDYAFFFLFFPENRLDFSCNLSPQEKICMKCQTLFSRKKSNKNNQNVVCCTFTKHTECSKSHLLIVGWRIIKANSNCNVVGYGDVVVSVLTHCRLNELPHTIYWKSPFSVLGRWGYEI